MFVSKGAGIKMVRGNMDKVHPGSQAAKTLDCNFELVRTQNKNTQRGFGSSSDSLKREMDRVRGGQRNEMTDERRNPQAF